MSIIICPIEHSFKSIHTKIAYRFQATIAARGYHVNKTITWSDVKDGDLVSVEVEDDNSSKKIDPYCCAIKAMVGRTSPQLKTVGHVPREISRHIFFFLKEESGKIDGFIHSTQYRPLPIPAGGLEIPLMLTFKSPTFLTHKKMKQFITTLYSYDYEGIGPEEVDEDSEIHFAVEEKEAGDDDCSVIEKKQKRRRPPIIAYSSTEDEDEVSPDELMVGYSEV